MEIKILLIPIIATLLIVGVISFILFTGDEEVSDTKIIKESKENVQTKSTGKKTTKETEKDTKAKKTAAKQQEKSPSKTQEDTEEESYEEEEFSEGDIPEEESYEEEESFEDDIESDEEYSEEDINEQEIDVSSLESALQPIIDYKYSITEKYKKLLPLTVKITSSDEVSYLKVTAAGILIEEDIKEPDIELEGSLEDIYLMANSKSAEELKLNLPKINFDIKTNTFKGATLITTLEELSGTTLVEDRSLLQSLIGTGVSIATGKFFMDITEATGNFVLTGKI